MNLRVAAIVGPTAVGKTDVSIEVAEALGAEIVSIDSMQIYRGMDAGTAKPSPGMRERVPHHLIDLKDPGHELTVAEFQALARDAIADIAARGRLPLLVGGSGLYFRAVVDDLVFPPTSPSVRRSLEEQAESSGAEALHRRLQDLDPAAAARIDPSNSRRTVRALEVIEITGRPFSENAAWDRYESRYDLTVAGLRRERSELDERIARRVRLMLESGLGEEVEELKGLPWSRAASHALGYRQVSEAASGVAGEHIGEQIARATRRFARRQESWFGADPRICWFMADSRTLTQELTTFFKKLPNQGGNRTKGS